MLKALYDYGLRRQLTLPPGFIEKTVKAYISLFRGQRPCQHLSGR